jgi:hypothetical protein
MAFPGIYNINYYKGDTFEFSVFPKTSSNETFLLNDYTQIRFTISNILGPQVAGGPEKITINAYATKEDNSYVLCAIRPEDGAQLNAGQTYYYDVEIGRLRSPYDYVYTLLQGTISVSEQVTLPATLPGAPTNLAVTSLTLSSGTLSWVAPIGTAPISRYNIYFVASESLLIPLGNVPANQTSFSAIFSPPLIAGQPYVVGVRAENVSGEGPIAVISGNAPVPPP